MTAAKDAAIGARTACPPPLAQESKTANTVSKRRSIDLTQQFTRTTRKKWGRPRTQRRCWFMGIYLLSFTTVLSSRTTMLRILLDDMPARTNSVSAMRKGRSNSA
jgi:ABC-type uncharacterized transport system fused permease/ATPase subunit